MKVGYFFNGHLSDKVSASAKDSPDGNAWYSSSIIEEYLNKGDEVFLFGEDKDLKDYNQYGNKIFNSFEKEKRVKAYLESNHVKWEYTKDSCSIKVENFPKIDFLLLEWRFPIVGRNTIDDIDSPSFQYDLMMQEYLLENYDGPIILFDLDYKITLEDEERLKHKKNIFIIETSNRPVKRILDRVQVEIPFWMKRSNIIQNTEVSKYKDLVYIGSRYERDKSILEYLVPYSNKELFKVWFYGNWRKYADKYDELYVELGWRDIQYHNRVGHESFKEVYSDSVCCPLLAKEEYYQNGFMTARIQECLYFGSIPIGFRRHYSIEKYLPEILIAEDGDDFHKKVQFIKSLPLFERNELREQIWKNLDFMDVSFFINIILQKVKGELYDYKR